MTRKAVALRIPHFSLWTCYGYRQSPNAIYILVSRNLISGGVSRFTAGAIKLEVNNLNAYIERDKNIYFMRLKVGNGLVDR